MSKNKKTIKIPISDCHSMTELTGNKKIATVNFYETTIEGIRYIIDIISTADKQYYVRMTDITDGHYDEIDFAVFKRTHTQPSLYEIWEKEN